MFDRKTSATLVLIALLMVVLIGVLIGIYIMPNFESKTQNPEIVNNNLYFVTQAETGYGEIVIDHLYTTMLRIDDSVYLKNEEGSYIYFLKEKKSISFGSKENEVYTINDKNGDIMPYYIFRYGENANSSIYSVYSTRGVKLDNKDFASLEEAKKYIKAEMSFITLDISKLSETIKEKYQIIKPISYPTIDNKTQYIAKQKSGKEYGIIDETGEIIFDFTATKIDTLLESENAVKIEKDLKTYIYTSTSKMIEVENGFEYDVEKEYIIQKKGNTVNKVYAISGKIIISSIYDYNNDLIKINSASGTTYLLVQEEPNKYSLYDMSKGTKSQNLYNDVVLKYMDFYSDDVKIESIMFSLNGQYKTLDFTDMKIYNLNVLQNIYSVLDNGNKYIYK